MDDLLLNEIKSFIDSEGRLTAVPAKRKKQLIALCYIAERLPRGEVGNEKAVNALLNTYHTFGDPAWIRREFVEAGIMKRDAYGRSYEVAAAPEEVRGLLLGDM